MNRHALAAALIAFGLLALPGAHAGSCNSGGPDLVDTAAAAGSFSTLLAAVEAAGLTDTLKGDGPFTVFAPTDEAFAKLPEGTLESLLQPRNRDELTAILTYHVAAGRLTANRVAGLDRVTTLNGQRPEVRVRGGEVRVGPATVTTADLATSNGIIHVIDTVLLPSGDDVVTTAMSAGNFKTLAAALQAAGLVSALQGDGPFTVFAPTDEAFARLPEGTLDSLLRPENKDRLTTILTYHVAPGTIYSTDAEAGDRVETLQGSSATISVVGRRLQIDDAKVVTADIPAANGVIHVIDSVILPPEPRSAGGTATMRLIENAIAEGAPMYNRNQPRACTAVYRVAANGLLALGGDALTASDRSRLRSALDESRRTHDAQEQAWVMRRALDAVYRSAGSRAAMVRMDTH